MVKDWDTTTIGEFLDFKNGLNKGKDFFGVGTPIVNYMDVYKKRGLHANDIKGRVTLSRDEIKRFEVKKGDVFFTRTSETPEEVGYPSVMLDDITDCVFSGFVLRGRPKNNLFDIEYCQYAFFTPEIRKAIMTNCTYTTRALTNGRQLSAIELPLPQKSEQRAIAAALSDTDTYIDKLEKLIAKKRAIKQGAMRELLTGNRRLPGFKDEWVEKPLSYYISDFIVPMRDKPENLDGNIPWCRIEDFTGKYLYKSKSNQGVSMDTVKEMNLKIFPINTLIVSCSAYLGRCAIIKCDLVTNQTFIGLVPNQNVDVEYLFYVMCREEQRLNTLSSGTTISYLSREQFEEYSIIMPPKREEQSSIATVLSDMDEEIDELIAKLHKAKHIKQGMMSELLTGRIRLIQEETDHG